MPSSSVDQQSALSGGRGAPREQGGSARVGVLAHTAPYRGC